MPDASGRSFVPIDMNKHCLDCHTLEFEPAVTKRQVPHGSVDNVMATMQEFYANLALKDVAVDTVDTGDIRRGIPAASSATVSDEQRRRALAWADRKGAVVAQDLFEKRVCIVCHEVVRNTGPGMAPANILWSVHAAACARHVYAQGALRPRQAHNRSSAPTATRARASRRRAATSSLPDIASCRICHAGSTPATNKVVSTCVSCHGFHEPGHPPWNQRAALPIGGAVQAAAIAVRRIPDARHEAGPIAWRVATWLALALLAGCGGGGGGGSGVGRMQRRLPGGHAQLR